MKNNLFLKKYKITPDIGTKNLIHQKSFFGSNLVNIENIVFINDSSISYKELFIKNEKNKSGYQHGDKNIERLTSETEYSVSYSDLKQSFHTIKLYNQGVDTLQRNTLWEIDIDVKNILIKYLFYNFKKSRIFKNIKYDEFTNKDINISIQEYVTQNILNKYTFHEIEFYVKYYDIVTNKIYYNETLLQLNPLFDVTVYDQMYMVNNFTVKKKDVFNNHESVKIMYNQIKESGRYKFNYYFNLYFKRI
jgi:hypothetical protein